MYYFITLGLQFFYSPGCRTPDDDRPVCVKSINQPICQITDASSSHISSSHVCTIRTDTTTESNSVILQHGRADVFGAEIGQGASPMSSDKSLKVHIMRCTVIYVAAKATLYSFASWQNRHFGGVFRP